MSVLTAKSLNGGKRRMSDPRSRQRRERRRCPTRTAAVSPLIARRLAPFLRTKCDDLTGVCYMLCADIKTGPSFTQQVNGFAKRFAGKLTGKVLAGSPVSRLFPTKPFLNFAY